REPDESLSIELFFTERSDPARIEGFLARNAGWMNPADMLVIPVATGKRWLVRVAYGAYNNRAQAVQAEQQLPPRYRRASGPQLRSFANLRTPI
ncbi:MAG: hypothetical protein OEW21_18335, partial [Betaproteobacteria bacterium]|nr:hypothetical protein [Betaproteobacteria bacterium]